MICLKCGSETDNPKFCSKSCAVSYNNRGVRRHGKSHSICLGCGKEIPTANKYCSVKCGAKHRTKNYIQDWLDDKESGTVGKKHKRLSTRIRKHLFEEVGYKCELCGWNKINSHTGKYPLEIDHIDGNWLNNRPENLRVICPNCHSLSAHHRGANVGNSPEPRLHYN